MSSQFRAFIKHQFQAVSRYAVHSPFAFEFITKVLPHKKSAFGTDIERWRKECLKNKTEIEVEDFGAGYGGKQIRHVNKSIAAIAKSSARGRREGELLSRICQQYQRKSALELGTNLGFSAAYIAKGMERNKGNLLSIEGSSEIAKFASKTFQNLNLNIDQRIGEFDEALEAIEWGSFSPDFVLLDGNHQEAATIKYFDFLKPKLANGAIVILDDIHWSEGMYRAWQNITSRPDIPLTIDLFSMGIVFLDRDQAKQHFQFRFRTW